MYIHSNVENFFKINGMLYRTINMFKKKKKETHTFLNKATGLGYQHKKNIIDILLKI